MRNKAMERVVMRLVFGVLLVFCIGFFSPSASAQAQAQAQAPNNAAPAAAQPEFTTAGFGDWLLRCSQPEGRARNCEVIHAVTVQGQTLAQLAIGRAAAGQPLMLTLVVAPNITVTTAPKIALPGAAGRASSNVDLNWRRCLPGLCFADANASDASLAQMRRQTENGRLDFQTADGRDMQLPISFRGISAALDALGREPSR
ncbi:MAG: invasion associated locus B family protein [Aquidulcibacter sp.]